MSTTPTNPETARGYPIRCNDCKKIKPPHPDKPHGHWCEECWNRRTSAVAAMHAPGADFAAVQKQFRSDKRSARHA
jgi:hypothetical protein